MTLSKLSLRNAKRQAQDYLIYFITIVMAAALMYAFNGLIFSGEIRSLSKVLDSLPLVIVLASIVVVCIIGWLVSYTTRFMLSKRSRELGTYILLGLENKQVARIFFLENLVVGGVAIVIGTLLGNLIYQALRAVTLTLFDVPYTFSFRFSIQAVLLTLLYFALIYLLALRKSSKRIRAMKIYDLLYLNRQNESETIKTDRARRKVFTISIITGILGTVLLMLRSLPTGIVGAAMIIVFLYGFFISFSSGVPGFFNKRPGKKYKGFNLLVFRFLSSKLASMGVVMATIAVLFTATLIAEGSGMLFHSLFQQRSEQTTCFDLFIGSTAQEEGYFDEYLDYIDTTIPVTQNYRYDVYLADDAKVQDYVKTKTDYIELFEKDTLMSFQDYATLRAMLGYSPVQLEEGHYIVHCMAYLKDTLTDYPDTITAGGQTLSRGGLYTESFTQSLWDGNGRGFILVVPDEVLAAQPVSHSIYAAMTSAPVSEDAYEGLRAIRDEKDTSIGGYDTIFSKAALENENASMYAMIVFPLYYLALVLTMVAATILSIQLLSESKRYRHHYDLLHNLGMDSRDMKRSLFRQFAIFFAMPALPPLLISIPFVLATGSAMDPGVLTSPGHLWMITLTMLAIFFVIYLVYILAAYTSFKRSVLPE
ncbi:ABC transporter permease [Anaerolentibacter hominis]|uniref:ABC transporter permease n=1 Tax=Anaerolentibacter hominis TaxID=3079009 RepID=UPI0031B84142